MFQEGVETPLLPGFGGQGGDYHLAEQKETVLVCVQLFF